MDEPTTELNTIAERYAAVVADGLRFSALEEEISPPFTQANLTEVMLFLVLGARWAEKVKDAPDYEDAAVQEVLAEVTELTKTPLALVGMIASRGKRILDVATTVIFKQGTSPGPLDSEVTQFKSEAGEAMLFGLRLKEKQGGEGEQGISDTNSTP